MAEAGGGDQDSAIPDAVVDFGRGEPATHPAIQDGLVSALPSCPCGSCWCALPSDGLYLEASCLREGWRPPAIGLLTSRLGCCFALRESGLR